MDIRIYEYFVKPVAVNRLMAAMKNSIAVIEQERKLSLS
ncbi:hypothetical protein HNQ56_004047 [Anaerotaenia torta]